MTDEGEVVLVEVLLVSSSDEGDVLEVGEALLVLLVGKEERHCRARRVEADVSALSVARGERGGAGLRSRARPRAARSEGNRTGDARWGCFMRTANQKAGIFEIASFRAAYS